MPTHPAFRRNARQFAEHLDGVIGRIVTGHCPFQHSVNEALGTAYLHFRTNQCDVDDGCFIDISLTIMPNPSFPKEKVTTIAYSMALVIGQDRDTDWVVRYEFSKTFQEERSLLSGSHLHVNATHHAYQQFAKKRRPGYDFDRLHFPTFRISVEQFLAWIVDDLSIPTQSVKEDALELLAESHNRFAAEKRTHFG